MKNVLITGAGRGIGLALTKEFSQHGYKVLGTYRDEASAKALLQLTREHSNIMAVTADVTNEKSFSALTEEIKKLGSIDIVVNNSGVIGEKGRSLMDIKFENLNEVFQVNTFGPMRVAQTVLPFMKKGATLAQITSLMGSIKDNSSGGYYDYRMSKAALNMFNKCLSIEYPEIKCLVLHPGWVQTDMGGAGASVTVDDCVRGLYKVISESTVAQSGNFFDYRGKPLEW